MPGPPWDHDDPADARRIIQNLDRLIGSIRSDPSARQAPDVDAVRRWHAAVYQGCRPPIAEYAGHFRGDTTVPELVGYEVGLGPRQLDGYPDRMGLPASELHDAVLGLLANLGDAVERLDGLVPAR